jgi:ATP-dependent DNA helicase RecG
MAQSRYEKALVDRAHGTRRWETEPAEGVGLRDIDRDEVFRIVEIARSLGRLVGPVGTRLADILDRLKLRRDGKILQAAVVLFGKEFMPDYPQCELRMARFRGTDKTEFLDQRQLRGPAFKLLEEAQLFCQRHFPLPGKIVPERLRRVETPLIPPDAMREILVNAFIHRDYSIAGGAVSLAIFDDRVEIWSAGTFPAGITPDMLTRKHLSVLRNPTIAEMFQRAGLIEQWGRGTNRVIEMCRAAGIAVPTFQEIGPFAVVTFRVRVGVTAASTAASPGGARSESGQSRGSESGQGRKPKSPVADAGAPTEIRVLAALTDGPLARSGVVRGLGHKSLSGAIRKAISVLLRDEWIDRAIPLTPVTPIDWGPSALVITGWCPDSSHVQRPMTPSRSSSPSRRSGLLPAILRCLPAIGRWRGAAGNRGQEAAPTRGSRGRAADRSRRRLQSPQSIGGDLLWSSPAGVPT